MLVAAGQFAVTSVWENNAEICASLMAQAAENDVSLFVLPEALLARDDHDADLSVKSAQLLEGEFLGRLRRESKRNMMTTILTIHVPSTPGRAWNMLVALQAGNIVARYAKLHLYDAFAIQESRRVDAGNEIAPLLEVEGMKVGLMTCYDLRFPELALAQALQGAEIHGTSCCTGSWAAQRASLVNVACRSCAGYHLLYGGGGGVREQKYRAKPDYRSLWRHHCGSVRNACTHYGGSDARTCASGARATSRFKQPSLCAAAIIMMFFYSALDSPCYRLLLCARVE